MISELHRFVFVILDDFQALDLFGPLDVIGAAKELGAHNYEMVTAAFTPSPVASETGTKVLPDVVLSEGMKVDTLVICGGKGARKQGLQEQQITLLRHLFDKSERVVSICTGAFVLARLGIADGMRMATHWHYTDELAELNSTIEIDADALYVKEGKLWSSAGVTAGIDLMLALVTEDHNHALSTAVARQLVVYMRRQGGQTQFSTPLKAQATDAGRLAPLLDWMVNNLTGPMTVTSMAARVNLSPRQFSRVFQDHMGEPPAKYVERLRLDHARVLLSGDGGRIDEIAQQVGYNSADSFRRAFERRFAVCPSFYQKQFSPGAA